ncbi:NepR family anti-sigma factor [Pseudooceanicola antarcticus]|uniref:NepR family anti-sigma factor n=1 Tax=Pseudooceanicola antarcticus TaxID=1247613 RepID=UPI002FCD4683
MEVAGLEETVILSPFFAFLGNPTPRLALSSASRENFSDTLKGNKTLGQTKPSNEGGVDDNLRRVFQSTLEEDIPDRFKDLLNQLKEQGSSASRHGEDNE